MAELETTEDQEQYFDTAGKPVTLERLIRLEPSWAASRIRLYRETLRLIANTVGVCPEAHAVGVDVVAILRERHPEMFTKGSDE